MKPTLAINGLKVSVEGKEILKGVDLEIKGGEVHAIMGPNGTGKSTLSMAVMGHPRYEVTEGTITLDGDNVLDMGVDERSRNGLFLAMQYPKEVSGITNADFVRTALNKRKHGTEVSFMKFFQRFEKAVKELKMREDLPHRYLNEGFSGGEKKRNEILQMKVLEPKIAILDEIDSGLDVDALRIVGENVSSMVNDNFGCLLITHYQRLLDHIKPDFVHVMIDGKIVKTGGKELITKIDEEGYDWVKAELGIDFDPFDMELDRKVILGDCAVKDVIKE
ncbi:Fe-S cluster assembly ATPase SufC [Mycoplasmatota bacterium WC44]